MDRVKQRITPGAKNMSQSDLPSVKPDLKEKLTFSTKMAYGAGDLGPAITAMILLTFLSPFLTNVAHLSPGLAGQSQLVGKIWDAINDPIVGMMSDRGNLFGEKVKQRWGRRYPWMLVGAIPFGLFFFLQWLVPFGVENQLGLFAFYTLISILFNTFYTVVNLPYTALTAELTQDYDERTSLSSFRFTFSIGGSILALLIALAAFSLKISAQSQYLLIGGLCATISILPIFWSVFGTRRQARLNAEPQDELAAMGWLEQMQSALANKPFLYVIGIYLSSWFSLQLTSAVIPYFVVNYMGLNDQGVTLVLLAVQGTALSMLSVWSKLAQKLGKKTVYVIGMVLWIFAQAGLFLLQPGQVGLMYGLAVLAGLGVSTAYLVPWSMLPDVIELDELNTGRRREGFFYSFMVFSQKICLGFAVALMLQSLQATGFKPPVDNIAQVQSPEVLMALRWSIGPIPTISLICGLICAYFYPITKERHQQTLLALAERKQHAADH
jgi:glycoside/pentoside/hexuronide:cation symporter, GPH family